MLHIGKGQIDETTHFNIYECHGLTEPAAYEETNTQGVRIETEEISSYRCTV